MKYVKKQFEVDAFQWNGSDDFKDMPIWAVDAITINKIFFGVDDEVDNNPVMLINSHRGVLVANKGDYIIKGVEDDIYPCRESIFKESYIDPRGAKTVDVLAIDNNRYVLSERHLDQDYVDCDSIASCISVKCDTCPLLNDVQVSKSKVDIIRTFY